MNRFICLESLHVVKHFLEQVNHYKINGHNNMFLVTCLTYEPLSSIALTIATMQALCTYMKCICSGLVHHHPSCMYDLIVPDFSRQNGPVYLTKVSSYSEV